DAYRIQLSVSRARLQSRWTNAAAELESWVASAPAPAAFDRCVRSGSVDSVILFDEQGRVRYPNVPSASRIDFGETSPQWQRASQLEHVGQYAEAADNYHALANATSNAPVAARNFQAEARCRLQAGQLEAVIQLVEEVFGHEQYRHAADPQGRLIAANAE